MLPVSVPTASILCACTGAGLLRLGDGIIASPAGRTRRAGRHCAS
jgi:hypothetical protein